MPNSGVACLLLQSQFLSRNHEKSLDELAEETGTLPLPLLPNDGSEAPSVIPSAAACQFPPGPAGSQPSPVDSAMHAAFQGSLHRVDLRRLGGGAQRLNTRAIRLSPNSAARNRCMLRGQVRAKLLVRANAILQK